MTIREIIEARAREAAERVGNDAGLAWDTKELTEYIQTIIIAILTDPQVGFKEALELAHRNRFLCQNCRRSLWDRACPEYCPCPCHTAEAKLEELKELSK